MVAQHATGEIISAVGGEVVAALFPLLIGMLGQNVPLGLGIGVFSAVSYGIVIVAALSLPETRGKQLQAR